MTMSPSNRIRETQIFFAKYPSRKLTFTLGELRFALEMSRLLTKNFENLGICLIWGFSDSLHRGVPQGFREKLRDEVCESLHPV